MSSQPVHTKVCIIGAGPAGATTSLFLCKMKIPHVIVDAAVFPRDKVCGDALDLKVMRVLNQLDGNVVQNEVLNNDNFEKAYGATVIVSKKKQYSLHIQHDKNNPLNYPFFFVSKRAYFDNFLVNKIDRAYADVRLGTKVKKLERQGDGWIIRTSNGSEEILIHANLIVGADGDHSTVLRRLGERKIDRQHYCGALRQYWKGISGMNSGNHLEIYLPKSLPLGYLWMFPLPNGEANVGCGLVSDLIAKRSVDLKKVFHELVHNDPEISHRFANATALEKPVGWGLPYASMRRQSSGEGYLLVGDAAAMICPTTGEGVGPGMMSGYIAAHFIARAIKQNRFDKSMFENYDREIYKRLEGDIKKYNFLRKVSPRLYNWLIIVLSATGVSNYYFKKNVAKWIHTTTSKKIEVEF
jgi:geranylgeranyl reductase family protein